MIMNLILVKWNGCFSSYKAPNKPHTGLFALACTLSVVKYV